MITRHLALISLSSRVSMEQTIAMAAAYNIQFAQHFTPAWKIGATVQAFEARQKIPARYWPIRYQDDIGAPGAAGFHEDANGIPFSLVQVGRTFDDTSLTGSHEALEMVLDPWGKEMVEGDAPVVRLGRVSFLREACDPPEADAFAYRINGVRVSDFIMPDFYAPTGTTGGQYSFTGAIKKPRTILKGGYISFRSADGQWWQQTWFNGKQAKIAGPFNWELGRHGRNWREIADACANAQRNGGNVEQYR